MHLPPAVQPKVGRASWCGGSLVLSALCACGPGGGDPSAPAGPDAGTGTVIVVDPAPPPATPS
jgi:hypothetical protein